ncbi:MAG: hypothetical protein JWQ02_2258, partial [Capsulimonas sp.]|nr:hypothetical protein [Capsulimonas sp.]
MSLFTNLKIAYKLAIGFGFCLFLSAALTLVGMRQMANQQRVAALISSDSVAGLQQLTVLVGQSRQLRILQYRHMVTKDAAGRSKAEADMAACIDTMNATIKEYRVGTTDPEDIKNVEDLKTKWEAFLQYQDQIIAFGRANNLTDGTKLMAGEMKSHFNAMTDVLNAMTAWNKVQSDQYARASADAYHTGIAQLSAIFVVALTLGFIFSVVITRQITRPLQAVTEGYASIQNNCITSLTTAIEALEHGDLTVRAEATTKPIEVKSRDEIGQVTETFNTMVAKVRSSISSFERSQASLTGIVGELQMAAGRVTQTSNSVSSVAQQVGSGSEEISATMGEVSSASEQSARGASEVAQGAASQAVSLASSRERIKN